MKFGFSYEFLFYLLLIVILAYISLEYFNVIEGNRGKPKRPKILNPGSLVPKGNTCIINKYGQTICTSDLK